VKSYTSEDLDCSGLLELRDEIYTYDEGYVTAAKNYLQALIEHANQAEHLAKANRRNRVEKWKAGK
jgi:hypothetical protein